MIDGYPRIPQSFWEAHSSEFLTELQKMHWHYLDTSGRQTGGRRNITIRQFCEETFTRFPKMLPFRADWERRLEEWIDIRKRTSIGCALIIDESFKYCLLLKGFWSKLWQLPGGKVETGESYTDCAIRETREEVGFDISSKVDESLSVYMAGPPRNVTTYIIEGVPFNTPFKALTKGEVDPIRWYEISRLPTESVVTTANPSSNKDARNEFSLLSPLIPGLQSYAALRKMEKSRSDAFEGSWTKREDMKHCMQATSTVASPSSSSSSSVEERGKCNDP
ncbi:hypothetical protein Aperf_G00000110629 [Anoplocephala perfoliata]